MKKTIAIIVAAGRGHRFGGAIPKQYNNLGSAMVLTRSIATFMAHPDIAGVKVVIHPDDMPLYRLAVGNMEILPPVFGGETRQDSVRLGLESIKDLNPDYVLIHDGARPFVDFSIINSALDTLTSETASIAAVKVCDTIKKADGNFVAETIDRSNLWRAQTPQSFHYEKILQAHLVAKDLNLTDDAAIIENIGKKVVFSKGSENNFKITTKEDLERAENMLKNYETRIGTGYDVHQLGKGDKKPMIIGGVNIKFDGHLIGHSDADVALHALTDALLGAIGAGDIGQHFPPSDNKWKGASSDQFLKHAVRIMQGLGGKISNADITIICEEPKIGPYKYPIATKISEILEVSQSKVNVKATTTEKLGFTGRKEGIASMASIAIKMPEL